MFFRPPRNILKYIFIGSLISSLFWLAIISYLLKDSTKNPPVIIEAHAGYDDMKDKKLLNPIKGHLGIIRNDDDINKRNQGYEKFSFNLLVSERIGYHRNIPDTRHDRCRREFKTYNEAVLPKASIIICFHNEAKSTLLRTMHSILDRTSDVLIHEIILLDDQSDKGVTIQELKTHIFSNEIKKVKIFRTQRREGLIKARLNGARKATGKVLVFLDSHCEVNKNWLPPLLIRILKDRRKVVCPMIDIINADTFDYTASPMVKGGFNWGLHFSWEHISDKELADPESFAKPFRSPTMAGGLFAIDRKYFFTLGGYDEGMDIWGGENLEISFRIWMCGGSLEIHPCSRVGHVFRDRRPYGNAGKGDTMGYNSQRVAEVWLDNYKIHFYNTRTDLKNAKFGDVSSRRKLRKDLKCRSFRWYLDNIYPELYIPMERSGAPFRNPWINKKKSKILLKSKLKNLQTGLCLDSSGFANDKKMNVELRSCDRVRVKYWVYNEDKELKTEGILCLDVVHKMKGMKLKIMKCHGEKAGQEWRFDVIARVDLLTTCFDGQKDKFWAWSANQVSTQMNSDAAIYAVDVKLQLSVMKRLHARRLIALYDQASKTFYNPASGMCLASDSVSQVGVLKICNQKEDQKWESVSENAL